MLDDVGLQATADASHRAKGFIHHSIKNDSITVANVDQWPADKELPRPRKNTWPEECLAMLTLLLAFGWVWLVPVCASLPLYLAMYHDLQLALAAACILIGFVIMPPSQEKVPGFLQMRLWDCWRRYFSMRAITPPLPYLSKHQNYMLVQLPHACFPLGCWLVLGMAGAPFTGLQMPVIRAAIADVMFSLPIIKHVLAWGGCYTAKKSTMLQLLAKGSIGLLPEGIAGIFLGARPEQEAVYLHKRKGFVRLAIQAGTDIVPVYHLGSSQLLTFKGFGKLSRRLRVTLGVFWGRWGLPLPRNHDIITLVGHPIPVSQQDDPSQAEVDRLHAQVLEAVQQLYNKHRHLLPGWEYKDLLIV